MKNIKQFQLILLFAVMAMTSCKKYLDEKSDKRLSELRTLDDLQALMDYNIYMNSGSTPGMGESSSDDYFLLTTDYNAISDPRKELYSWRLKDYSFTNDWSVNYRGLYPANYCLDYIQDIPRTDQNRAAWENVKGSALFHRAFRFLNLVWVYGKAYDSATSDADLGIVLRLNSDPSIKSVRSSVKTCYNRILTDAKEAAQLLPNNPLHTMRPSKVAAYGLLARTYLSMRIYDSAYRYSDLALQIKSDLLDYNSTADVNPAALLPFKASNKEIVFFATQNPAALLPFKASNKEIVFFATQGGNSSHGPTRALIDTILYATYQANDLRKAVFFQPRVGYYWFKGTYSATNNEDFFSGIATDELYLTRAECHARANRLPEALIDLNALLKMRWKGTSFTPIGALPQQQTINLILLERRKELVMRGLRWSDVKRLNKEGANIILKRMIGTQVYTLTPNEDRYALALPRDIIDITGMLQNPGWE